MSLLYKDKKKSVDTEGAFTEPPSPIHSVCFSNIGSRKRQEDRCGFVTGADGKHLFAVLSDGMGGLNDSSDVSELILNMLLERFDESIDWSDINLFDAVSDVNTKVNEMLGQDGIYKSGATLVAVHITPEGFQWIAVGDSKICIIRNNTLICLNEPHNYMNVLLNDVLDGNLTIEGALGDQDVEKLTSFIGMGKLAYIDYSRQIIPLKQGDVILLMSDGVFGSVPDEKIVTVFKKSKELAMAADKLEKAVLKKKRKNQDNFSAVCIEYSQSDIQDGG